ncbi:uncharacterized protein V1516DRAFT_571240 [Lipomyces oligophaga]|uniref:uncharacterized protein n=1 Tax=Lipomyces oligophaga TaxID=45792 RepID=UPI0034CE5AD4
MDFEALRLTPADAVGVQTETVAVNHRALITRTLSKYPVDHALFRELIQNSADAGASTVQVEFFTDNIRPIKLENIMDIHKSKAKKLRVRNDGMYFRPEDWDRLREIAKGNPDETKIGAFGVGFYSVFAVTDEPMVVSGKSAMKFYYEGDQLHYRRIELTEEQQRDSGVWTTIDLPYATPKSLPDLQHFTSFLAQSLTFVKLQTIELIVDNIKLLQIEKVKSDPAPLEIPKEINLKSLDQSMKIDRAETESVQIKAKYLNVTQLGKQEEKSKGLLSLGLKLFQSLSVESEKPSEYTEAVLFLRNITAYITTSISNSFAQKMKGAIMKPPPKHASISMIALNKSEADSSQLKSGIASQLFPTSIEEAKIFIGFPTKQTTGLKSHIATPQAIPTMERAAVDMANAYVKDWNRQMMYMAGILTRIVYGTEMRNIGMLIPENKKTRRMELTTDIYDRASYTMRQFFFENSTPDVQIGMSIATGFWKSAASVPLITSQGLRQSNEARAMEDINFLQDVAMVPKDMYDRAPQFHEQVQKFGLIRSVNVQDIKSEFSKRPLDTGKMIAFLRWAIQKIKAGDLTLIDMRSMLMYALLADEHMGTIDMNSLAYYHNKSIVPEDMPVPFSCLPYVVAKEFRTDDLQMLGWKPLDIVAWTHYLTGPFAENLPIDQNISVTPAFAHKVLNAISNRWSSTNLTEKTGLNSALSPTTCIPTQKGMKRPSESYLHEVRMFPDLAVVDVTVKNDVFEGMLTFIGVRKTVELKYVMERLHSDEKSRKWSSEDMIVYLASQQKDMKAEDLNFLMINEIVSSAFDDRLHKVSELYQPSDSLRDLGLPLLRWTVSEWNSRSTEASFLFKLGLNRYPSVETVIDLAARAETPEARDKLLFYFVSFYDQNQYRSSYSPRASIRFLPASISMGDKIETKTVAPTECYTSSSMALFQLPVLRKDLQSDGWKFGVVSDASIDVLVSRLVVNPPQTKSLAVKMFSYLAGKMNELGETQLRQLRESAFIPLFDADGNTLSFRIPVNVFVDEGGSNQTEEMFYRQFFDFVDYGIASNSFLRFCGVRNKPDLFELARLTVSEPNAMYVTAGGFERYKNLLVQFEKNWVELSTDSRLITDMRNSTFLIACKYNDNDEPAKSESTGRPGERVTEEEDDLFKNEDGLEYVLARASEIVINDDVVNYNFFKSEILSAPFDSDVEKFYSRIGSLNMSNIVQETLSVGAAINSPDVLSTRRRIIERTKLYIDMNPRVGLRIPFSQFERQFQIASVSRITVQRSIIRLRLSRRLEPVLASTTASFMTISRADAPRILYMTPKFDWFDVAQSITKVLLERQSPVAATVLESMLISTLSNLEGRGYNVKRLINKHKQEEEAGRAAKEKLLADAKLKEENLKKAQADELEKLKQDLIDKNTSSNSGQTSEGNRKSRSVKDGDDDDDDLPPFAEIVSGQDGREILAAANQRAVSTGSKKGLDKMLNKLRRSSSQQIPGGWETSSASQQQQPHQQQQSHMESRTSGGRPLTDADTRNLLEEGIRHLTPYSGDQLQNSQMSWTPAEAMRESASVSAQTMCDSNVAHNLKLVGQVTARGPKVYVSTNVPGQQIPRDMITMMKLFAATLEKVAVSIFGADWNSVNMYYDEKGESVAFNYGGSLFFNLRYFARDVRSTQMRNMSGAFNISMAIDYWFPVMAHELAHNLETSHGQRHSFFSESYIQQFAGSYRRVTRELDGPK